MFVHHKRASVSLTASERGPGPGCGQRGWIWAAGLAVRPAGGYTSGVEWHQPGGRISLIATDRALHRVGPAGDEAMTSLQQVLRGSPYQGYCYAYPHKTAYRPLQPPV